MSSLTTLARPYSKAAFALANNDGDLNTWDRLLKVAATIVSEPTMARVLANPSVSSDEATGIITEALEGAASEQFSGFLTVLAENGRLAILPEVSALFSVLRQEAEKRLNVRVISAVALQEDQAERLKLSLAKRFDREIELESEIDPAILGGAIIYAGDQVIDGSLQGRLAKLQSNLAS